MAFYLYQAIGPFNTNLQTSANFTTKQNIAPAPRPLLLGHNHIRPEAIFHLTAKGSFATSGTTPTLALGFYYGAPAGTITGDIGLSLAQTLPNTATVEFPWEMEWKGKCTGIGTSGALLGQGHLMMASALGVYSLPAAIPGTVAGRTITLNTSLEWAIGVSGTFSAASAANTVTVNEFTLTLCN